MEAAGLVILDYARLFLELWPLIVVPAALLVLVRPVARLVFAALGLLSYYVVGWSMAPFGPDDSRMIFPFLGLALLPAAAIAEGLARLLRAAKRRSWIGRREG